MEYILPPRLKKGAHIRVIAPARSIAVIGEEQAQKTKARLEALGYQVSFSKHSHENFAFNSGQVDGRVEDLHEAFEDDDVDAILTVTGGFNSNQLLDRIDYTLIKAHPKILCGYSDITALTNAITAKTGIVTYSGPHFSSFGMEKGNEYTIEHFRRALETSEPYVVEPSEEWSDDLWFLDQEDRMFIPNPGPVAINPGKAKGRLVGGNLCTFILLHGTKYMPSLQDTILFIEEDASFGEDTAMFVDRHLQSIIQQPGFTGVKGIIFGRPQKGTNMDEKAFRTIVGMKPELKEMPIAYGFDFGHTCPMTTLPVGGDAELTVADTVELRITRH